MDTFGPSDRITRTELARELVELFEQLDSADINEALAKNVPLENLEFFAAYAEDFAELTEIEGDARGQLPNLMLLGYLLRLLEERLAADIEPADA